ncbi:hypothetical protein [Methanococcoides burtonii]|uniref:Uncharacterized protein n=1 Tax=Methanococcoides burtonii (strain DSM 6242 / NBRC 107633 / OCM 468 / ACE-M) TaxID=259564 RepID=Q12VS6_METBU|nr:hypothetical protein [Methanococcoides burtonii]ABE52450.1 Hypothetical protein Mbur_1544 [Methanococcoides burtonii DSM 6242]
MDEAILIIGIIFFAAISLYNLVHSIRHKKSYLPSVFGILMALATALILFDRPLIGGFAFVIIFLLAIFSSGKIFGIRKRSFLKAMEGVEINSKFSLRYVTNIKYWAAYALNNGPKKAAVGYSLIQTVLIALVLVIFTYVFPRPTNFLTLVPFILVLFLMSLREYVIIFKEFNESKL